MATAYECDYCKVTMIGEPRNQTDLNIPGTNFVMRFSFGLRRTGPELEEAQAEAEEHASILRQLIGAARVNQDSVEHVRADLCDPCRARLLREAVELSGLDLHEV